MESVEQRLRSYAPLWGRWQPGRRIYQSSSCAVFLLESQRLDEPQASVVKVITVPAGGDEPGEGLDRVLDEIHAMEQLRDCGNVVTLYDDAFCPLPDGGCDVLIRMERLTCLSDLLREGEVLPPEEVRRLACDVASALAAAHRAGIVHRDVKPANIYRTAQGVYQLGDFSVARQSPRPFLETMIGTVAYMAPEVARGDGYDGRADVYSLGVVLYQLLNDNCLPLSDADASQAQREAAVRRRWDGSRLPPPPHGDRALRRAVLRCCAPDPARRFPSADALLDALHPPGADRFWVPAAVTGWSFAVVAALALVLLPSYQGVLAPADEPPAAALPSGDTLEQSDATHRYTVVRAAVTWEEANVYCTSRGGHLATILDQEQFDAVVAMLEEAGIENAWLGASDLNSSGGYQWVTGERFDFAAWAIGEPNRTNGEEHYLMMYNKDGQGWVWNDSRLDGLSMFAPEVCGFICQWDEAADA